MTEEVRRPQRKPPRPALASRILAVGASAAATIGLVGAMVARSPAPTPAARTSAAPPPSQPVHIVVVIKRPQQSWSQSGSQSVTRAPSVSSAPQIVRRYVAAPAVTTTHGS